MDRRTRIGGVRGHIRGVVESTRRHTLGGSGEKQGQSRSLYKGVKLIQAKKKAVLPDRLFQIFKDVLLTRVPDGESSE